MQLFLLTGLCLCLFASNSILCRAALIEWGMDPLQYTAVRALSAAAMLAFLCLRQAGKGSTPKQALMSAWHESSWSGAAFLFAYMICFSVGYIGIPSAAGTLIINMSVQVAMLGWGVWLGMRLTGWQRTGLIMACVGLFTLLLPGLSTPPLWSAMLMACSGLAWGGYSLVGRKATSAAMATAGNFIRCVPVALVVLVIGCVRGPAPDFQALVCALVAGSLASALGYILWYRVVVCYSLTASSVIQLAVPVITAVLAVIFLGEPITLRLVLCAILILGGIGTAMVSGR